MIATITGYPGGVGKPATAAVFVAAQGPTCLIGGDANWSATGWKARGDLPFQVIDSLCAPRLTKNSEHHIIDK